MKKQRIVFRTGELFAGSGGLGLGTKLAKVVLQKETWEYEHVWATDYNKDACETYRSNLMPERRKSVICEDIRKIDFKKLEKISVIDFLSFGFPCNDFSVVGEQKGINGTYGPLYTYGVNFLEYFQPKCFLAENVNGLRNANEGETFRIILRDFERAGYRVVPHLYKFEEYGIPQTRHRIIIVGIRKDINVDFRVPSPQKYMHYDNTAKKAIEVPPIPENALNHEFTKQSSRVVERLKYIKPGENAFTATIPEHLQLNVKGAKISQIYKRLTPNQPAYTVTGSGGGGTHVYHWSENRALTNRERARLQTFPDHFVFAGSKESVRRQVGMAVPPLAAKIILEAILHCFAHIPYEWVEPNIGLPCPRSGGRTTC